MCETSGKLYCTQCRCCARKGLWVNKNMEPAFTIHGFQNWKNAIPTFKEHTNSKHHRECVAQFQVFVSQQPSVATQLDTQLQANQRINREMLIKQLTSLSFLAGQALAIEGKHCSNLYKLMQLRSEDCPNIKRWLKERNYMCHDIVNEMIHLTSLDVLQKVLLPIRDGYYAILADETKDIANKEQLVTVLWWVDDTYMVREDFVGLFDLPKTDAHTIFTVLNDILRWCNILPELCRGQAYDDAANMSGHLKGVAASFKVHNPAAIFVHCLAHCLNLCLQDAGKKCKVIRDALDIVHDVTHLIKQSPKQNHVFQSLKNEMKPDTQNLRTLCPTRWTVRTGALKSVIDKYSVLATAMEEFSEESHDECSRKAGGILAMFEKFSTYFGLRLAYLFFSPTEQLSKTLQATNTMLQDTQSAATVTQTFIKRQRSDEAFDSFFKSVIEASKNLTEGPQLPRRRRLPKRLGGGDTAHAFESPSEYYRKQYFEVLDLLNNELSHRFDQSDFGVVMDMEKLLVAAASGKQVTLPSSLTSLYAEDFDLDSLRAQLSMLPDTLKTSGIQTQV